MNQKHGRHIVLHIDTIWWHANLRRWTKLTAKKPTVVHIYLS